MIEFRVWGFRLGCWNLGIENLGLERREIASVSELEVKTVLRLKTHFKRQQKNVSISPVLTEVGPAQLNLCFSRMWLNKLFVIKANSCVISFGPHLITAQFYSMRNFSKINMKINWYLKTLYILCNFLNIKQKCFNR